MTQEQWDHMVNLKSKEEEIDKKYFQKYAETVARESEQNKETAD